MGWFGVRLRRLCIRLCSLDGVHFIDPVTDGPHHPYFQVRFHIEDVSPLELTVALARHIPDLRQEVRLPPSNPLHPPPVLRPAVLAKSSQVMCVGVLLAR